MVIALIVVAVIAALAIGFLFARRSATPVINPVGELAGRLSQLTDQTDRLSDLLQKRLDDVSSAMGQKLDENSIRTAQSLGEIQTRLSVIDEAQKNLFSLSNEIAGFRNLLSNKQARGAFGEVQLKDLVKSILPPSAYSFQKALVNGNRVDCLIILPNPPGPIAVDAKFPLESYHGLHKAQDAIERERATKVFADAIGKHIDDIATRYIVPGETAEQALMFLPSEAVYAEIHAHHPKIVEKSFRQKVYIVSPTTLMATLQTVRAILIDVKMREQAGQIQKEVQKLLDDIARLDHRVESLVKHFGQANQDLDQVQKSTFKIAHSGQRIKEVRLEDAPVTDETFTSPTEKLEITKN